MADAYESYIDLVNLVVDMSAFITKMGVLHEDAGMASANVMFLDRLKHINGTAEFGAEEPCNYGC